MSTSSRRLRFAVVNEVLADGPGWSDHVRRIEQSGAGTLLVRDHIAAEPFGPQLAPLAMLSAAAVQTTRLRVGTMVLDNDYRHPALVAHEAATIDWLSGGRFELGLGAGWLRGEYAQMGLSFDPARTRIARLGEAASIITALLSGETVTFGGVHYGIDSLSLPITPVQRPRPPLLIGGGGPRMLALAARHADIVGILPARPSAAARTPTTRPTGLQRHSTQSSACWKPLPGNDSVRWSSAPLQRFWSQTNGGATPRCSYSNGGGAGLPARKYGTCRRSSLGRPSRSIKTC
jgi:probable F420-dependent oxidoreductase